MISVILGLFLISPTAAIDDRDHSRCDFYEAYYLRRIGEPRQAYFLLNRFMKTEKDPTWLARAVEETQKAANEIPPEQLGTVKQDLAAFLSGESPTSAPRTGDQSATKQKTSSVSDDWHVITQARLDAHELDLRDIDSHRARYRQLVAQGRPFEAARLNTRLSLGAAMKRTHAEVTRIEEQIAGIRESEETYRKRGLDQFADQYAQTIQRQQSKISGLKSKRELLRSMTKKPVLGKELLLSAFADPNAPSGQAANDFRGWLVGLDFARKQNLAAAEIPAVDALEKAFEQVVASLEKNQLESAEATIARIRDWCLDPSESAELQID